MVTVFYNDMVKGIPVDDQLIDPFVWVKYDLELVRFQFIEIIMKGRIQDMDLPHQG